MKKQLFAAMLITLFANLSAIEVNHGPVIIKPIKSTIQDLGPAKAPISYGPGYAQAPDFMEISQKIDLESEDLHKEIALLAENLTTKLQDLRKPENSNLFKCLILKAAAYIHAADLKSPAGVAVASTELGNKADSFFKLTMENKAGLQGLVNSLEGLIFGGLTGIRLQGQAYNIYSWARGQFNKLNAQDKAHARNFIILVLAKVYEQNGLVPLLCPLLISPKTLEPGE